MRLVEVYPAEPPTVSLRLQPADRARDGVAPASLLNQECGTRRIGKAIVVHVEPARQAESRLEGKGADKCAGVVALRFEERRERVEACMESEILRCRARRDRREAGLTGCSRATEASPRYARGHS